MSLRRSAVAGAVLSAALLAACTSPQNNAHPQASADIAPTGAISPNPTVGKVKLLALSHGVLISGEVSGLAPNSIHGFHIHEKGDCGDNGNASGGHFNPTGAVHDRFGAPGTHAGELPSLQADANGVARFSVTSHAVSLTEGAPDNILGRALIVHRDPDDFVTQPAGNSGPRIGCAVITKL
ncbi:superoxide dismutase family protein [Xylophilus sp.]|uniref:superoxide dismutase family protein n=1 Tax=Xylophilus sp. TaxID=2653893 RepID=UPI0013B7CEB9|nr:superoxide dismutase family protein [Xylophilus sp.]KAF1049400.1 MAG: Superoxide dismutase-like protein YojM [Xylophilus sp.]